MNWFRFNHYLLVINYCHSSAGLPAILVTFCLKYTLLTRVIYETLVA